MINILPLKLLSFIYLIIIYDLIKIIFNWIYFFIWNNVLRAALCVDSTTESLKYTETSLELINDWNTWILYNTLPFDSFSVLYLKKECLG